MEDHGCFICRKHDGLEASPPGGYIFEDEHWMVCHAPVDNGPLGTLFIESRRHVLDFADFSNDEAKSFGKLVRKVYKALRSQIAAERVYQLSMMEGIPHFHTWIVPRTSDITERGIVFLARDMKATVEGAEDLARLLRAELG
jgi:diadenosine tetraphosphate (Ap4A) HIT family hydrolase